MTSTFDPQQYKTTTRAQWEDAAEAWHRWGPVIEDWLGAGHRADARRRRRHHRQPGARRRRRRRRAEPRRGPAGRARPGTSWPPTSPRPSSEYAAKAATDAGLTNVATRELDGEQPRRRRGRLRRGHLPGRADLLPGPAGRAGRHAPALRPGGRLSAVVYSTADRNGFFAIPVGIIRRRAQLPPPAPGQPGPFSLGAPASPRGASPRPGSATSPSTTVPSPLRMRQRRRVRRASNASRSARCTRCSPACPSRTGRPPGPRSARRSPSSKDRTGSSARARCSSSPATRWREPQ